MSRPAVSPSVCVKVIRVCVVTAASLGLPAEKALARLGVAPELLADPTARVSHDLLVRAWTELPALVESASFGLCAGELASSSAFDVVDHAIASSSTMRDALEALLRYQRLLHDANDVQMEAMPHGEVRVSQRLRVPGRMPPHMCDFIAAMWILRSALLSGKRAVVRVELMRPAPADLGEHRRVLQAPLAFAAERNALWFRAADLDAPVTRADPSLYAVLRRHADDLLAALPSGSSLATALHRHFLGTLAAGPPSIDAAASALGVSTRSLQRKLEEEGTSFKAVLDDARRALAISYLRDGSRTVSEVAFLVGFSEVSAFSRAFRRWTGDSAVRFRRAPA